MKKLTLLITLFLCLLTTGFPQNSGRIARLLAEADTLISDNKLQEALAKTEQASSVSGSNKEVQKYRINIYYLMQNDKEAMRYADEAIKKYPHDQDFLYLRGIINNSTGRYGKALDDFTTALESGKNGALYKIYLNRGIAYQYLQEYDSAMTDFTRAIELKDTAASVYQGRAMLHYEMKDYSAAVNDFNKVLELGKENSAILFNLGMSYFRLEQKEKACPLLQKSCTLGNKNACRMSLMECIKTIPDVR
jgi:tetratricopeptide (TPR) repeat protein